MIRLISSVLLPLALAACGSRIVPATAPVPAPAPADIETSLYLIGDAGAPKPDEPVLAALTRLLRADPARSAVVFLGDNIYPRGLPAPGRAGYDSATIRLDTQIEVLTSTGVRGWFVPGNHDWARFSSGGWEAIRRQDARIAERGGSLVTLLPHGGCPGPEVVDVGTRLRLVLLDTQWWLQGGPRPSAPEDGCAPFTEAGVEAALAAALGSAGDRRVIVGGHHPLASGGEHGGFFDWKDHLFPLRNLAPWLWVPLPGLGSVYPISRNLGITSQDISSGRYQRMIRAFSRAFRAHPPLAYAAGHEHGLQVIQGGPAPWQLVSGAGIYGHEGPLVGISGTLLALQEAGFMRVDILSDGRVRLAVITVDHAGRDQETYSRWLTLPAPERPANADPDHPAPRRAN